MTHQENQFLGEVWGNEKGLAVAASANPSSWLRGPALNCGSDR